MGAKTKWVALLSHYVWSTTIYQLQPMIACVPLSLTRIIFFLLRCHFVNVSSKPKLIMSKTLKCFSYAIIHWEPKFAFYMVGYMHTITRKHARHQIIASYSCLLSFENNYLEQSTHYKSWSILDKTVFFKNELKERLRLAELQTGHFQRSHNNPNWRILKILITLGT